MSEKLKEGYSGKVCFLNDKEMDFRAEIQFDNYHRGIITIYGVSREIFLEQSRANMIQQLCLLENKEYISIFN